MIDGGRRQEILKTIIRFSKTKGA